MKLYQRPKAPCVALSQAACSGDQKYPSFELRIIFEYLSSLGHKTWCQQQLDALNLPDLHHDVAFISAHQAFSGLSSVTSMFYQPGMGCEVAKNYRIKDLGAIGACISNASTLGEAMEISQVYYDLIGSFTDIVNIVDEHTFVNRLIDVARLEPQTLQFLFELTIMGMVSIAREIADVDIDIKVVRFTAKLSLEEKNMYSKHFKCDIEDQAKFNEWVVNLESLQAPIIDHLMTPSVSATNLKILLEELANEQGLVDDIDCILKGSSGDFPDPDMISHALGMSSRTLRRRLSNMGTSFSSLIDKVRCQLAINLIQHQSLSNEALAEELGYSDAANFYTAFKKWTGNSPNYYRLTD